MEITAMVLQLVEIHILQAPLFAEVMEEIQGDITLMLVVEVIKQLQAMALMAEETVVVLSE